MLGPFAVTGVRSYQVAGRPDAAARWLDQVIRAVGPVRHVVEPAIDHATGLVRLADGSVVLARESFEAAIRGWDARGRRWEGLWRAWTWRARSSDRTATQPGWISCDTCASRRSGWAASLS